MDTTELDIIAMIRTANDPTKALEIAMELALELLGQLSTHQHKSSSYLRASSE